MDLYRINLNLLIALDALLTTCSVTVAAKKLFISQAAMSNNLHQLRELFKDELLVREKKALVPTTFALELHPKLHQIIQELASLVSSGQRFDPLTSTRVFRIGMSDHAAYLILPELSILLQQQAPNLTIEVIPINQFGLSEPFENGNLDLGLGLVLGAEKNIRHNLLFSETGLCIMHPKHELAKQNLTLKHYLAAKHITVRYQRPPYITNIDRALKHLGHQRELKYIMPYLAPIFTIIAHNRELLASVPARLAKLHWRKNNFIMKPLPFTIPLAEIHLVWHHRHEQDSGHLWLRQQIQTIAQQLIK